MPVYSIYISHYLRNGEHVSSETKLYDVPFTKGDPNILIDPKVKGEMGKAGTFEFSIYSNHPYYNCWKQMKTMMRVEYFGETIFYGRVLTIDVDHLTSKKSIHCEGYLAFLIDTPQEGKPDANRNYISVNTYINQVISAHNSMMTAVSDPYSPSKIFTIGEIPGGYSGADAGQRVTVDSEDVKYGSSSWTDTASALNTLTSEFGGYLRARYVNASEIRLDWLDAYYRDTTDDRIIEVGNNVLALSSSSEVDNIFTVLIPIGKNATDSKNSDAVMLTPKELYVKDIGSIYSDAELNTGYHTKEEYLNSLNEYGVIYKVQNFSNADTVDKLRTYAWDWIKNNYHGELTSFTATAIDLKIIGGNSTILVGDRVKVQYDGNKQRILTVVSAEYNLHKPDGNSYTIGIPDISLNKTYGESVSESSSKKNAKKGTAKAKGGGGSDSPPYGDEDGLTKKVNHFFHSHVLDASNNSAEYQAYKEKYGVKAAGSILRTTAAMFINAVEEESTPQRDKAEKQLLKTLIIDGHDGTMKGFKPVDTNIYRAMSNEQAEAYYKAMASMSVDVVENSLSFGELVDIDGGWSTSDYANKKPNLLLKLGIDKDGSDQGGTLLTRFSRRAQDKTVTEQKTTTMTNGAKGSFTGGKIALTHSFGNNIIEQIAKDETGQLKGTVNLDGPTAKVSTTNLTDYTKDTIVLDGNGTSGEGTLDVGRDTNNGMRINLNHPVTYKDKNGNTHTANGFVSAEDFQLKDQYDSLRVKLLVVDDLIADRATIGQLTAVEGKIDDLTAIAITTQNLKGQIASLNNIDVQSLTIDHIVGSWKYLDVVTSITQNATTKAISVGKTRIYYFGYEVD